MKKKQLEIKLEDIPSHPTPKAELEQYSTPPVIAADILFTALLNGDIDNKKVIDLGCGTGIFSLGSALLGASEVIGVDTDEEAVLTAINVRDGWGLKDIVEFEVEDVEKYQGSSDTVIMNPPFGAQKRGADIPFLNKAVEIAPTIYSLHNAKTVDFIYKFFLNNEYSVVGEKRYMCVINNIYPFHKKEKKEIEVVLLVSKRK